MSDGYCNGCYGAAKKSGRSVRMTPYSKYEVCPVCESRFREGLVHYHPSNGTEFMMFQERCEDCRYFDDAGTYDYKVKACGYGILDKLLNGMFEESDSQCFWFHPTDLEDGCPATCKRFEERRDDDNGPMRPVFDDPAQMTFDDLNIPVEPAATTTILEVRHA